MLCEGMSSGYVWNMIIYTGQGTLLSEDYTGLSVSAQVVRNLMSPLLGPFQYIIPILPDNEVNITPQLAGTLVQNMTDVYGLSLIHI